MSTFKPSYQFINRSNRNISISMSERNFENNEIINYPPISLPKKQLYLPRSSKEENKLLNHRFTKSGAIQKTEYDPEAPVPKPETAPTPSEGDKGTPKPPASTELVQADDYPEDAKINSEVTNIESAAKYLRSLDIPVNVSKKGEIIELAKENRVFFPNW